MLHRDSREIVNTDDHLTNLLGEASCSGWDLGRSQRAPNRYCTTCANVPEVFRSVVMVIVCAVAVLGKDERDGAVKSDVGMVWGLLRSVGGQGV
jgi:hypothetical protein